MKKILLATVALCALSLPMAVSVAVGAPSPYVEQAVSKLPQEKAENFRDAMQQAHEENKDLYDQAHQIREDMHNLLIAETFDADAFSSKSKELQQVHDKITANLDDAFVQATADLSQAERKTLAKALERADAKKQAAKKGE